MLTFFSIETVELLCGAQDCHSVLVKKVSDTSKLPIYSTNLTLKVYTVTKILGMFLSRGKKNP